jgi:hypothetical protein
MLREIERRGQRVLVIDSMKLRREESEAVGGFLSIREALSFGATHTPKTGKREIPIARKLAALLGEIEQGPREVHVAVTVAGEPWGQSGLDRAFARVRDRAGVAGGSAHALRDRRPRQRRPASRGKSPRGNSLPG